MSDKRQEFITNFIKIYERHPALWKKSSDCYKDRSLRNKGYNELLEYYKKFYTIADLKCVRMKIQSLRGTFQKELKKAKLFERSRKSSNETYVPSLWYYDLLLFTLENEQPIESIYIEECDENFVKPEEDLLETYSDYQITEPNISESTCHQLPSTSSLTSSPTIKKTKIEENEHEFLRAFSETLEPNTSEKDHYDVLGQYAAQKMRCLEDEHQKIFAEGLIMKVFRNAALNKLTENSVIVENPQHMNK